MVRTETAYEISVSTDERRSAVYCYAETESLGLELSKGKGWYGGSGYSNGPVEVITISLPGGKSASFKMKDAITVYHENDYKFILEQKAREAALAKLTEADKKVLGLK